MNVWLVFYFLINGVWTPGDFAQPDGWSSMKYESFEKCEERKVFAQENFIPTLEKEMQGLVKVTCQTNDPKIFWKRKVQIPQLPASLTNSE